VRPHSIPEIATRAAAGIQEFDACVREFLDECQLMPREQRSLALETEQQKLDGVKDAYLAALAEHLALSDRLPVPQWTEQTDRFLSEPFFAGGLESLKAILLVESPLAFRRRLIFISADGLSRPSRQLTEEAV
jgi:hypothetical protein